MKILTTYRGWIIGLGLLILWMITFPPQRPTFQPEHLPGSWKISIDQTDVFWVFEPDGQFLYQIRPRNPWARWMGLDMDLPGTWRLQGQSLTIEFTSTPLPLWLSGQNLAGEKITLEITTLTTTTLDFRKKANESLWGPFERVTSPQKP